MTCSTGPLLLAELVVDSAAERLLSVDVPALRQSECATPLCASDHGGPALGVHVGVGVGIRFDRQDDTVGQISDWLEPVLVS
jgi:hypothetical protein